MGLIDLDGSNYRHSQINSKTSFLPSIMPAHFYVPDLPNWSWLGQEKITPFSREKIRRFLAPKGYNIVWVLEGGRK